MEPISTTKPTGAGIAPDVMADLEAVCTTRGIVRDPELRRRIIARADAARREMLEKFGVQDIGAEIIREMRESR